MNGWWVGLTLLGLGTLVTGWFVLGLCRSGAATTAMDAKAEARLDDLAESAGVVVYQPGFHDYMNLPTGVRELTFAYLESMWAQPAEGPSES